MKVVQINSSCEFGSTGRIALEISKRLDSKGVENYIFYSGNRKSGYKNGVLINNKLQIRIHQVLSRLFGDQGWHSYFTTVKLVKKLKELSPDVIHLHNLHGYYLHMGVLFSYLSKTDAKVIWTLHDCWAFTGHCTYFSRVNCKKWTRQCHNCSQKGDYPYSLIFDRSKALFNKKKNLYKSVPNMLITTVSGWLMNITSSSKLLANHRICAIPNGVDTQIFKPYNPLTNISGVDISNKKVILGVANVWSERKGISDFKDLAQKITDDYLIVLVGVKKEQMTDMPQNIICLERTDSVKALAQLYSTAFVYFNASTEETFGLTTIEAMACGTPVITYKATACSEPVAEGTGFSLIPQDIDGVWQSIQKIEDKENYSDKCINHVSDNYDAEKIYYQYISLYFNEKEEK